MSMSAMASSKILFAWFILMAFMAMVMANRIFLDDVKIDDAWYDAHATFYGDMSGNETMKGACGYGDLFKQGYGLETAALSTALFNDGATCGACFKIMCVNDPQWCYKGAGTIKITATNFCPPNNTERTGAWCNPPQKHFDLSMPMFVKLAPMRAGIIPVKYRRVLCRKQGGVKFEINGNQWWTLALVYNVGGAGDVADVKVKGSASDWVPMRRNWGQNWQANKVFVGQGLSFVVTTSDGKSAQFDNVVPANWQFGRTYEGGTNF